MSVQTNNYVGFGAMVDYPEPYEVLDHFDDYLDSAYNTEIVEIDGISVIADGMGAEYVFFGKLFYKSQVYEDIDYFLNKKLEFHLTKQEKLDIMLKVDIMYPTSYDKKFEWVKFTHYR